MSRTTSFKLVLLGESAVGKSSLVLRFVRNEFSDFRESTIGAAFLTQTVNLDESTAIKFEIWDTAGQERYKSLAPIYFRNSNAAVIVYDITQPPETSFEKAKSWVRELQRQADPSIVIMLVGNKSDLAANRKTSREMGEAYAQEEGLLFVEASAKSGDGVEELFMEIGKSMFVFAARSMLTASARKLPTTPLPQRAAPGAKGVKVQGQLEQAQSACTC